MLTLSTGPSLFHQRNLSNWVGICLPLRFLVPPPLFLLQMCIFHRGSTYRNGADSHSNLGEISSALQVCVVHLPSSRIYSNPQQNFLFVSWLVGELLEGGEIVSLWVQLPSGAGDRNASIIRIFIRGWIMPGHYPNDQGSLCKSSFVFFLMQET